MIISSFDAVEKQQELSSSAGGNVSWSVHFGKHIVWQYVNIYIPYDPAIPFVGIYPSEMCLHAHKKIYLYKSIFTITAFHKYKLEIILKSINNRMGK